MSKTKKRLKKPELPVPQTLAEAEALLYRIGLTERSVAVLESEMNGMLASIKDGFEKRAAPLVESIEADVAALHAWAEANRSTLLDAGKKTAQIATGEIGWRRTPPAVRISGVKAVIAALKTLGLKRFIRVKEEIDKDAMKKEPDVAAAVPGVKLTQQEEFWIKPFGSEIERSRTQKVNDGAAS
jgi:phage host-nuclease inhibitor protein Gam